MKKLLSLILALTLAFALLPTFAAAVNMEPAILTPTEFTLDFKTVTSSLDELTVNNATKQRYYIKVEDEFFGSNWSFLTDPEKTTIHGIDGDKAIVYFGASNELRLYFNLTSDNIAEGYDTAAIEIDVPKSGI
ncbi:MAG: hypothetical protein E7473_12260, partial [Ruminococcaceae bacterium]|nr:hypothetical protein [Oscillospiraceae bacterium]